VISRSTLFAHAAWLALAPVASAHAVPGGAIGTLPTGQYRCELPGDILGEVHDHVPEADFQIITASNYSAEGGRGSYLLTGDSVVMTGGPFKGRKFLRISRGLLRMTQDKEMQGKLRCVLTSRR